MLAEGELDDLLVGLEETDPEQEWADGLLAGGVELLPLTQQQRHQFQPGLPRLQLGVLPPDRKDDIIY